MLLLQDARRQRMLVVGVKNRHSLLQDDRSVVEIGVHEVHGASRHSYAVIESLLLRVEAGKCRQQ